MSQYRKKLFVLAAILMSVVALYSYRFLPEKRYVISEDRQINTYIFGAKAPLGGRVASWLDESQKAYRCVYPPGMNDYSYYCSFNFGFEVGPKSGIDLSQYERINLRVRYVGDAPKMRFFARNYNSLYSKREDTNSTKYNSIYIPTKELKGELSLRISEFLVTEWWLLLYDLPRELSFPELSNVVTLGIEFSDSMTLGNHDVTIEKVEFVGSWVSRERWYLFIICVWLSGVFLYTVNSLRLMRKRRLLDEQTILALHQSNQSLEKETDKFRRLSTVDALTEVYNRFGIDQVVTAIMNSAASADRGQPVMSLIILDIDHFKSINDTYGHDVGDEILRKIAASISDHVRDADYVGRWGGEEFVILLPFTSLDKANELAEALRMRIYRSNYMPTLELDVTVSLGVASIKPEEAFADVFKRADDALYEAKHTGRNRSCHSR